MMGHYHIRDTRRMRQAIIERRMQASVKNSSVDSRKTSTCQYKCRVKYSTKR